MRQSRLSSRTTHVNQHPLPPSGSRPSPGPPPVQPGPPGTDRGPWPRQALTPSFPRLPASAFVCQWALFNRHGTQMDGAGRCATVLPSHSTPTGRLAAGDIPGRAPYRFLSIGFRIDNAGIRKMKKKIQPVGPVRNTDSTTVTWDLRHHSAERF